MELGRKQQELHGVLLNSQEKRRARRASEHAVHGRRSSHDAVNELAITTPQQYDSFVRRGRVARAQLLLRKYFAGRSNLGRLRKQLKHRSLLVSNETS